MMICSVSRFVILICFQFQTDSRHLPTTHVHARDVDIQNAWIFDGSVDFIQIETFYLVNDCCMTVFLALERHTGEFLYYLLFFYLETDATKKILYCTGVQLTKTWLCHANWMGYVLCGRYQFTRERERLHSLSYTFDYTVINVKS